MKSKLNITEKDKLQCKYTWDWDNSRDYTEGPPEGAYGYIYAHRNMKNGKIYIGQKKSTTVNFNYPGSGGKYTKALTAYGTQCFTYDILHWCLNKEDLSSCETDLIRITRYVYDTHNVYNVADGGWKNQFSVNGEIYEEQGVLMRERRLQECATAKGAALLHAMQEKAHSKESAEKISNTLKAYAKTAEGKNVISKMVEVAHTKEACAKRGNNLRTMYATTEKGQLLKEAHSDYMKFKCKTVKYIIKAAKSRVQNTVLLTYDNITYNTSAECLFNGVLKLNYDAHIDAYTYKLYSYLRTLVKHTRNRGTGIYTIVCCSPSTPSKMAARTHDKTKVYTSYSELNNIILVIK